MGVGEWVINLYVEDDRNRDYAKRNIFQRISQLFRGGKNAIECDQTDGREVAIGK